MADKKIEKAVAGEVSALGNQDITGGFLSPLLVKPQDSVLIARGGDYKIYEEVLRDEQVKSTFQQRQLALISREFEVEAGGDSAIDKAAADFIREQLEGFARWDDVCAKMLFGQFYGYAVAEMIWEFDGSQVVIGDIRVRRRQRFSFDRNGGLRLIKRGKPDGELMPERKFWTFATGADNDDDPYGLGLAHWLYWPVFFKRNDIKFWLIFLEKFGAPTGKGVFPVNASEDEKSALLAAVAAVATETGIILPEGYEIELLEAARRGAADYHTMARYMDAAISKIVLSQTMTTDDGSSQSQASVHMDVRDELVKADSDLLCASFNGGPLHWLTEWNFPGAATPRVWRRVESDPDLKPQAERDKIISYLGWEPTEDYIRETYGDGFTRKPETPAPGAGQDVPPEPSATAFAEHDDDSIDRLLAEELDRGGWQKLLGPAVDEILGLAGDAASFEEFRAQLGDRLDDTAIETLVEALAKAAFATRIAGGVDADINDA